MTSNETIEGVEWKTGTRSRRCAAGCRRVVEHSFAPDSGREVRAHLCRRAEEHGAERRDARHHARRSVAAHSRRPAHDARLSHARRRTNRFTTRRTPGAFTSSIWFANGCRKKAAWTAMQHENEEKADLIYDAIDATDFYRGHADPDSRSIMNVTFRLPSEDLEKNSPAKRRRRAGRLERPSLSRRHSRFDLQRVSERGLRSAGCVHEGV